VKTSFSERKKTCKRQCRQPAEISAENAKLAKSQRPNFMQICQNMAEKGPNFFEVGLTHKTLDTLKKKPVKSVELPVPDFFPIAKPNLCKRQLNQPLDNRVCAAEFFRQRPNFSGNLAGKIWPELATMENDDARQVG
jgi:hypothetical protein